MKDYLKMLGIWIKAKAARFREEEVGAGEIVAVVVILAIVIMLGFMFQTQITELFGNLWNAVLGEQDQFTNTHPGS